MCEFFLLFSYNEINEIHQLLYVAPVEFLFTYGVRIASLLQLNIL